MPTVTPKATAGAGILRGPLTFTHSTAGLNNGITFYTPTAGEFLLGCAFIFDVDFDGTARGDIGTFTGGNVGLFSSSAVANGGFFTGGLLVVDGITIMTPGLGEFGNMYALTADPLKLVVSQNGQKGGTAINSTVGSGRLYIVTAAPVSL